MDEATGVLASAPPADRRSKVGLVIYFAALTGVCALVFAPSVRAGFFEDDFGYLNVTLAPGWWHTSPTWDLAAQVFRPITILAIGTQRELFGFHPQSFHVVALGLLLVQGILLYLVGRRLGLARVGSLAASTVLMLHTTNGWSLAWTASTSSLYSVIFGLVVVWLLASEQPGRRQVVGATAVFVLALLSREISMTLPFIVLVIRYSIGDGAWRARARQAFRETTPLFVVLGAYLAARLGFSAYARSKPEAPRLVPILDWTSFRETLPDVPAHLRDLVTLATSPFYAVYDPATGLHFPAAVFVVAVVVWAVIVGLVVREARAGRWIGSVGLAWFVIGILPPLFLQPDMTYGNYTDMALPGLALAVGAIVESLSRSLPARLRPVMGGLGVAVLVALAVSGGNYLVDPGPPLIARAAFLEAQARREYPDPAPGSTIVIRGSIPEDVLWTSNGDLFRAMYDDPDLQVVFDPNPGG